MAPNLLLSPSVFTQAKSSGGLSAVVQESCPAPSTLSRPPLQEEIRVLSRSQLQATLLHLIQVKIILQKVSNTFYVLCFKSFDNVHLLCLCFVLSRAPQLFAWEKQSICVNKHACTQTYSTMILARVFQTDSSFLDTIYEAYVSRFANDSSSKY